MHIIGTPHLWFASLFLFFAWAKAGMGAGGIEAFGGACDFVADVSGMFLVWQFSIRIQCMRIATPMTFA